MKINSPFSFFKKISNAIFFACLFFINCQQKKESKFSTDFTKEHLFTSGIEGPATNSLGEIFAVNFKKEGTIGKVDAKGKVTLFASLPDNSIGNGIRFDKGGNMYIADYVNHSIYCIPKGSTQPIVYASGASMNQPNDLAIAPNGILYLSDPNWSDNTGNLWMVKDKKIILLEKNMGTTNGIEVSPDGKKLYVNESIQRKIWVYDILKDDTLSNKKLFTSFKDFGLDGMRCDLNGNLYVCRYGKGTVVVISPEGKIVREIQLKGKKPSNITAGKNYRQWFVTMADRGCFETFF